MKPVIGLEFEHAHWLGDDHKPLRMRVTRIAKGIVYYRSLDGSLPTFCDIEKFSKYVRTITSALR